jgi:AcrR family transcriptional regulator
MTRWEPNASGRLQQAALELYSERGYDQTTVTEIAKRAGLTERTFFRYFADKREVLFYGSGILQDRLVQWIDDAPDTVSPIDAVGGALAAAAEPIEEIRGFSRLRSRHSRRHSRPRCAGAASRTRRRAWPPRLASPFSRSRTCAGPMSPVIAAKRRWPS